MFENKDTLIQAMKKPMCIAKMALEEIQDRMGGTKIIADPNTPFCHLLEFGSSISSMCVQAIDEKMPQLYPKRAQSMQDLYHHMSDFDYLRMYATPASATIRIALPKKYLIDNAMPFNNNYKKLTIPKDTVFMVGRYPFGIHYPIDILVNLFTESFTVAHDVSQENPLLVLTKNIVDKFDFVYKSLEYLLIDIPVYQFAKSVIEKPLIAEAGFAEKILYNDYFYAVRLFSYKDGKYTELHQSQSKMVYDTSVPTVLTRILPDEQKLMLTIPQIYFDKGMLGSKLYIEMYTTMGAMDIDTTNISGASIQINFSKRTKDSTDFSAIFKNLPFDLIRNLTSSKIVGGSMPISVDKLRERVVNDTLYERVPIKESDIVVYLEDNGFLVKKYKDNVTDRIYYAYRVMEDGNGAIVPSIALPMRMMSNYPADYPSFLLQSDRTITILPTTMYTYADSRNDIAPISADKMFEIANMDKPQLVEELNNNQYLKSPFHVWVNLTDYYPQAISFNLMNPEVKKIIFEAENYNVAAKMIAFEARAMHCDAGVGGYKVHLNVYRSDDLRQYDAGYTHIYVATKSTSGYWIGTECSYVGFVQEGNVDVFEFSIQTNYHLSQNEELGVTNFQGINIELPEHMIKLEQDFYLIYAVDTEILTGTWEDASAAITQGVPTDFLVGRVAMSRQYLTLHLGHSLADVINNNIEAATTPQQYAMWKTDVPLVYDEDVYARTPHGDLMTEVIDDRLHLKKLYEKDELVLAEDGSPVYLHRRGDIRFSFGKPIVESDRENLYFLDLILIDAKVFASERTAELDFVSKMYDVMEGYFAQLRKLQDQLLERTEVFFRCVRSTGTGKFNIGDNVVVSQKIEMSFDLICYTYAYVLKDESIQKLIKDKICEVIEDNIKTRVISMLDIFDTVKEQLSDYVHHFTLLGINGDTKNQTFEILSEDAQPSIRRELVLSEDNILSLSKCISIQFKTLEDHSSKSSYTV